MPSTTKKKQKYLYFNMTFKNYSITEQQKYNFAIIKELKWNPINYVYKLILINPASVQLPSLSLGRRGLCKLFFMHSLESVFRHQQTLKP